VTTINGQPTSVDARVDLRTPRGRADRLFRAALIACASTVLIVIALILGFLAWTARTSWYHFHVGLFTDVFSVNAQKFGIKADLIGSIVIGIVALCVASPIAIATALAINEYVPRWVRAPLTTLVDLLAALPSIIYGLWGALFLDHQMHGTVVWLRDHASFFPPFRVDGPQIGGGLFEAGIVVGIMVLPLMTSITREVMSQVPREDCEAALALGGTRWGMISTVILPFSRNGIVGGAMLALGRALGETIAVSLILNIDNSTTSHILQPHGGAIAAAIVSNFQGASRLEDSALTAAGLTLFALTLTVNVAARYIVARGHKAAAR
jgi:phosphate transport system permease protein